MDLIQSKTQNIKYEGPSNLSCYHCNKIFSTNLQLKSHLNYVNAYRMHECSIAGCSSIFNSSSRLRAHLAMHNGTRKHACQVSGCVYRARTASQLVQHQATHGLGYVYACNICEYQATTSSNLRRHIRQHLNTRPYICPHCETQFVDLSALRRHVLDSAHHPGLPLYVCPWCQPSSPFSTSSLMTITNTTLKEKTVKEPVGFNSSHLAWRHVVQTHPKELAHPDTMQRLGRKPGETLIEHDVPLIFGLYRPEEDAKLPPFLTIRQVFSRRTKIRSTNTQTKFRKRYGDLSYLQAPTTPGTSIPSLIEMSTSKIPRQICLQQIQIRLHQSRPSNISDLAKSSNSQKTFNHEPLMSLPGGAIWSLNALEAAFSHRGTAPP